MVKAKVALGLIAVLSRHGKVQVYFHAFFILASDNGE
jgi:hypothetical protein